MKNAPQAAATIDEYISGFPAEIQAGLQKLRTVIRESAPGAVEKISYGMPAFDLKGILVYFAAFKDHYGFFPTSSGVQVFKEELTGYATSKGTIRFPLDKPLPLDLVRRIVQYRAAENLSKAESKSQKN